MSQRQVVAPLRLFSGLYDTDRTPRIKKKIKKKKYRMGKVEYGIICGDFCNFGFWTTHWLNNETPVWVQLHGAFVILDYQFDLQLAINDDLCSEKWSSRPIYKPCEACRCHRAAQVSQGQDQPPHRHWLAPFMWRFLFDFVLLKINVGVCSFRVVKTCPFLFAAHVLMFCIVVCCCLLSGSLTISQFGRHEAL